MNEHGVGVSETSEEDVRNMDCGDQNDPIANREKNHQKNNDQQLCLLCGLKGSPPYVNHVFERIELMDMVRQMLGMSLVSDNILPSTICCNCIVKMNTCLEYQRCMYRNIFNHRIKYYRKCGDHINILKCQAELKRSQSNCMQSPNGVNESSNDNRLTIGEANSSAMIVSNDTNGLNISDVQTDVSTHELDSVDEHIVDDVVPPTIVAERLRPRFPSSAGKCDTESGGKIHTKIKVKTPRRKQPKTSKCEQNSIVRRRSNALRKTLRKKHRTTQRKSIGEKRKFKCHDCNQEFGSLKILRKHTDIHGTWYQCEFCYKEFRSVYQCGWHRISCKAKNVFTEESSPHCRTRSQTRSERMARQSDYLSGINSYEYESTGASQCKTNSPNVKHTYNDSNRVHSMVKLWTSQLHKGDKPDPKDLIAANIGDDDGISISSDISSMTRTSQTLGSTSSMPSRRLPSTKDSIAWTHEQMRRKLHRAGKLQAKQHGKEYYACAFRDFCVFGSTSMQKTMYHEVKVHNALLLHHCVECDEWFSNKENLIRHKRHHRPQIHICISCNNIFDNKHELEHHTLLHSEKTFNCQHCEMSFLKRSEHERHTNYYHRYDVLQRCGIISRVRAAHKSKVSPYLKQHRFQGYKSKELIQKSTAENIDQPAVSYADSSYSQRSRSPETDYDNQTDTQNDVGINSNAKRINIDGISTISISSRSSGESSTHDSENRKRFTKGRAQSDDANMKNDNANCVEGIDSEDINDFIDDEDKIYTITDTSDVDEDSDGEYHQQMANFNSFYHIASPVQYYDSWNNIAEMDLDRSMDRDRPASPHMSLDSFDVFSIANLGHDNPSLERESRGGPTAEHNYRSNNKFNINNSQPDANVLCLEVPRRKINHSFKSLPIALVNKYIPPYDVLFEKYLPKTNALADGFPVHNT